ncbi:hypothetical protein [Halobacillus ihumii]|uniref:hypothetical protein n=1 Tax=Halobacillus ihumii TaxID=2686092 RepID=UPI0013D0EEFC|nr:hypothetical protein [Halobacillus ihumii]
MPSIVKLELEIEKYCEEVETVKQQREKFIEEKGGIRNTSEDFEDPEEFFEAKLEGVPFYEVNEKHYYMESPKENIEKYIDNIEDIELHIDVTDCFNFYQYFYDAVTYDMKFADAVREVKNNDITRSLEQGDMEGLSLMSHEIGKMYQETESYYGKKKKAWESLYENSMLFKLEETLEKVRKEKEKTRERKEKVKV